MQARAEDEAAVARKFAEHEQELADKLQNHVALLESAHAAEMATLRAELDSARAQWESARTSLKEANTGLEARLQSMCDSRDDVAKQLARWQAQHQNCVSAADAAELGTNLQAAGEARSKSEKSRQKEAKEACIRFPHSLFSFFLYWRLTQLGGSGSTSVSLFSPTFSCLVAPIGCGLSV